MVVIRGWNGGGDLNGKKLLERNNTVPARASATPPIAYEKNSF